MSTLALSQSRSGDLGPVSVLLYLVGMVALVAMWIKGIVAAVSVSVTAAVVVGVLEPLPVIIGIWQTITHGLF